MQTLPQTFIVFDTEFTAWEGSRQRKWSGSNEYREIVQIAAIRTTLPSLPSEETFVRYVKPVKNPLLSPYFINLTGITQETLKTKGMSFEQAMTDFALWANDDHCYSYGMDVDVLVENSRLLTLNFPVEIARFHDIRNIFKSHGIPAEKYMSSTIVEAFGKKPTRRGHDALNDVKTIIDGLRYLPL